MRVRECIGERACEAAAGMCRTTQRRDARSLKSGSFERNGRYFGRVLFDRATGEESKRETTYCDMRTINTRLW